jgi:hypothetical protein
MSDSFATELASILAEDSRGESTAPPPLEPGDIEVYEVTVKTNRNRQRRMADSAAPPPTSGGQFSCFAFTVLTHRMQAVIVL